MTETPSVPPGRASSRRRAPAQDTSAASGGRAAARKNRRRKHKGLKITAMVVGFVVVIGGVGVAYAYNKLNGNIHSDDLYSGTGAGAGHEKADAFGRTPINILMIGSDSRTNAADCKLGGACTPGGGARADVEMVVHISADRSNATVMSIPRDLETALPACTDNDNHTSTPARTDMINSALNWGPGCSVAAVHQLTGIPIDHFMMVDFSGVVNMADAVGGVQVCVSDNVYDPYSHLKLSKGSHTLTGDAALEFLRTRHGFGDGTDTGRTVAQHLYLSSLISKLKSAGTLTNPSAIWSLANAATKSLTVDTGLNSISKMISLAGDVNKVPANRITFATMQTGQDPAPGMGGRLVVGPGAQTLFQTVSDDQSLTTASGKKSTAASSATAIPTGNIAVQVQNGTTIPGRAGAIAQALIAKGYSQQTAGGNGGSAATTLLTYPASQKAQAKAVAGTLGLPSSALKQGTGSQITLLIGNDWPTGNTFPGGKGKPAPADTAQALGGASVQNGGDNKGCAQVSHFSTIGATGAGQVTTATTPYGMTPVHAYEISPNVKNSAP
ncbi:LCP family protein [Streptomyces sp. SL13]|uniref:LCP family protein n=1 Tax=Streptantibioticus silvisoli TaxID=2705255 RepID=A0AA90GZF1_9ACTN|nr:LCP family protein [Streptantibioticus silvisoli]MDI5964868.1 LCP family protein [Streptantibioticus silvisoli]MDI5971133.1 LCP family protein [Streptantibioticus silvisoli]